MTKQMYPTRGISCLKLTHPSNLNQDLSLPSQTATQVLVVSMERHRPLEVSSPQLQWIKWIKFKPLLMPLLTRTSKTLSKNSNKVPIIVTNPLHSANKLSNQLSFWNIWRQILGNLKHLSDKKWLPLVKTVQILLNLNTSKNNNNPWVIQIPKVFKNCTLATMSFRLA